MLDPSARCGGGWQRTWVLAATSGSAEDGRHGFGTPISIDRGRYPQKMGQGENPGKVKVTPVCLSVCPGGILAAPRGNAASCLRNRKRSSLCTPCLTGSCQLAPRIPAAGASLSPSPRSVRPTEAASDSVLLTEAQGGAGFCLCVNSLLLFHK